MMLRTLTRRQEKGVRVKEEARDEVMWGFSLLVCWREERGGAR